MGFEEKEVPLNSFILSNFNYCPLVWHFCSSKSLKKIKNKNERFEYYNDFTSDYNQLLNKFSKTSMEVKRLRNIALEIFKTLNHLKPETWKNFFCKTTNLTHRPFNIKLNQNNTTKYDNKSLRRLGPHIWNFLPKQIKEETDFNQFKSVWRTPPRKMSSRQIPPSQITPRWTFLRKISPRKIPPYPFLKLFLLNKCFSSSWEYYFWKHAIKAKHLRDIIVPPDNLEGWEDKIF